MTFALLGAAPANAQNACIYSLSTGIAGPVEYTPGEASTLKVDVSLFAQPSNPMTIECLPGSNPLPLRIYVEPGHILLGNVDIFVARRPDPLHYEMRGGKLFAFPNLPVGSYRVTAEGWDEGGGTLKSFSRLEILPIPPVPKPNTAKKAMPAIISALD
ncbi:hypothetical protein ACQ86G_23670 [Roseateles chitinivorans]|uniref:hypothetical protein n=1 Tax=Roseateles chitinivorans TaxID=2917965 RepID=UPI003D667DFF